MSLYEAKSKTAQLYTALISNASKEKTTDIIKYLDEGANINERFDSDSNNTPLHISVSMEDSEVVNLLLQRGAKIDYKNKDGKTALDIANGLHSDVAGPLVELLERYRNKTQANTPDKVATNDKNKPKCKYQKRGGTSGIKGQLYETKLITLIRIRSFIKEYDYFYLGTSLEGIGALDDICIRYKQNNEDVIVFLQAKHRTEVTKGKVLASDLWKPKGDYSLLKYFNSYLKIRERFNNTKYCDVIFNGKYADVKCYLIIYTSSGNELKNKKTSEDCSTDKSVRDLIQSREYSDIFQYKYTDAEINLLTKSMLVEEMKCLGKSLWSFIKRNKFDIMLTDYYIRKYHVVLARSVINVTDINVAGHRTGAFSDNFFNDNNELLVTLKEIMFNESFKEVKVNRDNLKELVQIVVVEPTTINLSKLLQSVLICYNHKSHTLAITNIADKHTANALLEIKIKYSVYKEAYDIAVREKLSSICFKLPAIFGNIDIAVSDNKKGAKRLVYLAANIQKLISNYKDKVIVVNDALIGPNKLIDAGVMDLKGGIGSAVGNLLIASEEDESFKFNVDYETLGKNAKLLLNLLKSNINELDTYRLKFDIEEFPKLSLKANARDKISAIEFFNNLWFYTNQAKENEIESYSKEILVNYSINTKKVSERTATSARYDAVYSRIHDDVQKWWMSEGESYYLTNNKEIFDVISKEIFDNSLLHVLSNVYMKRTKKYDIQFDNISVQSLFMQFGPKITVIVTEAIVLTRIKLAHYYQTMKDCALIELDSSLLFSRNDKNMLKQEIKNNRFKTVIIIYENVSESKSELFQYIINETTEKQLIIVTNIHSLEQVEAFFHHDRNCIKVFDEKINFSDLVLTSQKKIVSSKLLFQGTEISFEDIMQEDAKHLMTPCILQKIINNEKIEVGGTISNANYEEIKHYYVDRRLSVEKETYKELYSQSITEKLNDFNRTFPPSLIESRRILKLNTFEDINDTVVLVGGPGTGKSTYLTHMSIKMKQRNPKIWIERLNLLEYSKEFYKWQEDRINIDIIHALKFLCKKVVLNKIRNYNVSYNSDELLLDLEIINGELVLHNYEAINESISFELGVFINCYNKGNIVLLFDGFDEICPHYKDEITELLKCLAKRCTGANSVGRSTTKQRMWIASRSYNNIVLTLQTEFGTPYDLEAFTESELKMSIKKFFKRNLNLNELNNEQIGNINGFFEYMRRNGDFSPEKKTQKAFKYSSFLLDVLYFTAVEYIQNEVEHIHLSDEKYIFAQKWRTVNTKKVHISDLLRVNAYNIIGVHCWNERRREKAMKLAITPLHMYVALDFFINQVKNNTLPNANIISKWDLEANTSSFYKYFLETKLKRIRYEQKNQMNIYKPDVKLAYDRELKEYLDKHKKLAFYATYINELKEILTEGEIDEIQKIIKEFEAAKEKTGVVDYIVNGVPKFIHLTFQEYLTLEYITDILKTKPQDQCRIWKFLVRYARKGVLEFFDRKLETDNELKSIYMNDEIKQSIFDAIFDDLNRRVNKRRNMPIIEEAVRMDLKYVTKFFLKIVVNILNEITINEFIEDKCILFNNIAGKGWNDILILVLDCIRKIDPNKLNMFDYGTTKRDFASFSNEDIIRDLQTELNCFTRLVVQRRYRCVLNGGTRRRWESL